ncbi:MAG: 1,4-dihydroxy-2-naphthoate polyprenyltransferase [Candidatus Sericytochromatia bacterium]|nr:1,4-dihydroxy-2-naphthoate polyprenyltransferase [Candidatus Sericytochromatia bacterium]
MPETLPTAVEAPPAGWRLWWAGARPRTLGVGAAPVLLGLGLAGTRTATETGGTSALRPDLFLACLLGALLLQIGCNYVNDVSDHQRGTDGPDRVGPLRLAAAGLASPRAIWTAAALCFAGASLCGAWLMVARGWPIAAIGVASIFAAVAYTSGPYPLAYHGLGELTVAVFFGPVAVLGTEFALTGSVSRWGGWLALVPAGLGAAVLAINNLRDREGDARSGKRTLAVKLGAPRTVQGIRTLILIPFAVPVVLAVGMARPWLALPMLMLPSATRLALAIRTDSPAPALNGALAMTGRLLFRMAFYMALVMLLMAKAPAFRG